MIFNHRTIHNLRRLISIRYENESEYARRSIYTLTTASAGQNIFAKQQESDMNVL